MAFADLRGKDGTVVIRKSRSGLVATPRTTPKNPKSVAQTGSRNALTKGSRGFANLTQAQAAAWNAYGATITKHNKVNGTSYTSTGIDAYNALATKLLQMSATATVPTTPPTSAFTGDSLAITVTAGTGQVTWTSTSPNSTNVRTELLLQPLKGKNRTPGAKGYRTKAFANFVAGGLSYSVNAPTGYFAAAYRYVNVLTGQTTPLVLLGVQTVALSVEDGGLGEASSKGQKAA